MNELTHDQIETGKTYVTPFGTMTVDTVTFKRLPREGKDAGEWRAHGTIDENGESSPGWYNVDELSGDGKYVTEVDSYEATIDEVQIDGKDYRLVRMHQGQVSMWELSELRYEFDEEECDLENGPDPNGPTRSLVGFELHSYGMGGCTDEQVVGFIRQNLEGDGEGRHPGPDTPLQTCACGTVVDQSYDQCPECHHFFRRGQ